MKLSSTLRADVVGGLVAFLLTFAAVIVVVAPKLLTHGQTRAEQQLELDSRRRQAAELDQNTAAMHKNLELLSAQVAASVQLQSAGRVNRRMGEMAARSEECSVTLARLSPGIPAAPTSLPPDSRAPASSEPKTTIVPITLSGSGTYPDICRYLHLLHDCFRDTAISSIKITGQPDPAASENHIATFTVDLAWHAAVAGSAGASPN